MVNGNAVTWKWVVGVLISATTIIVVGVLTRNFAAVEQNKNSIVDLKVSVASMGKDIEYTKDAVDKTNRGVEQIKEMLGKHMLRIGAPSP